MVILKGKRNGACIIHSTGSLIFPLIIPRGRRRDFTMKKSPEDDGVIPRAWASLGETSTRWNGSRLGRDPLPVPPSIFCGELNK